MNRPIAATAIADNGHLLLPLRATFESLNSTVSYDPTARVVLAKNLLHVLQLHVDSPRALLDGRLVTLEIPPRLIDNRVYVPLRFAAEAMGAIVRYDPRTRTVAVNGSDDYASSTLDIARAPQELTPPPNSSVLTAYPVVSASLGSAMAASNAVTLSVDGINVTSGAAFDGRTITYVPAAGLAPGRHTIAFQARSTLGHVFSTQWSFVTNAPPETAQADYAYAPYQFFAGPSQPYAGGTWMNFTVIGPPSGSGFVQICNPNFIYPLWNGGGSRYRARIALPALYAAGGCPINAVFIDGHGHRRFIVLSPIGSGIFLTGDPLHPIGQYPSGPIIVPILPLRTH